jgi:sugar (pentulose or hexulose) kinase
VWLRIKADTLGTTFEAMDCAEPTSLGAAMLAATTVTGRKLSALVGEWVRVRAVFKPSR